MPASTIESTIAFFESLPREDTLATCWLDADRALSQGRSCVRFVQDVVATPDNLLAARIRVKGEPEQVAAIYTRLLPDGTDHLAACCTCGDARHPCRHAMALAMALARRIRKHDAGFPEVDAADPRASALAPVLASETYAKARDAAIPGGPGGPGGSGEDADEDVDDEDFMDDEDARFGPPAEPLVTAIPLRTDGDAALAGLVGWNPEARTFDWDAILHPAIAASATPSPAREKVNKILDSIDDLFDEARAKFNRGDMDALCWDIDSLLALTNKAIADSGKDAEVLLRCREFLILMCKIVGCTSWSNLDRIRWLINMDVLDENDDFSCAHAADMDCTILSSREADTLAKELEQCMRDMGPLGANESPHALTRRATIYKWLQDCYDADGLGDDFIPRMRQRHIELGCTIELADDFSFDESSDKELHATCIEGIKHLQGVYPATRARLYRHLGDIANYQDNDKLALAYHLEAFMASLNDYDWRHLIDSADNSGLEDEVRTALAQYFETGVRDLSALGLPALESGPAPERYHDRFPVHEGLVVLALDDEDEDVLAKAYARWRTGTDHPIERLDRMVAANLTGRHADMKQGILVRILEQLPPNIPEDMLPAVVACLQSLQDLYIQQDRMADWEALADRLASRTNNMRHLYSMRPAIRIHPQRP